MQKSPDRFYIDIKDRDLYDKVAQECALFDTKGKKDQFLFCMAIGLSAGPRVELKKKDGFFLKKDLNSEDEALINALAVAESDSVDILAVPSEVHKIAEEYAHAGIKILVDKVRSVEFGSFWKHFEREIFEVSNAGK